MATHSSQSSFSENMGAFFRFLNCCGGSSADSDYDDDDQKPVLQISHPTNFRREDISIPGLTPEQQAFIRKKAREDAERMYMHLQPLCSFPSTTFAERPPPSLKPTFEQFTTPREAPSPGSQHAATFSGLVGSQMLEAERRGSVADIVRAHGRKISDALGKTGGYQGSGNAVEMRALMDGPAVASGEHRVSAESWGSDGIVGKGVLDGGRI